MQKIKRITDESKSAASHTIGLSKGVGRILEISILIPQVDL